MTERDYTSEIAELQAAYTANRVANATIATDVRSKYRAIIAEEIRVRREETDKKFADHLARVKERAQLPLHIIQDHVLHTKAWNRWTYWRDLANIPAERVSLSNAREARELAAQPYRWNEDYSFLWWLKDGNGNALPEPIGVELIADNKGVLVGWPEEKWGWGETTFGSYGGFGKFSSHFTGPAINAAIQAGHPVKETKKKEEETV